MFWFKISRDLINRHFLNGGGGGSELNKGIESYISLQPAGVNLLNFKLRLIDLTEFTVWHC